METLPATVAVFPKQTVKQKAFQGAVNAWVPNDEIGPDGMQVFLAKGRVCAAIVCSHSCELDKDERKSRVLVAPVMSASGLKVDVWEIIANQRRRSLMPLPALPKLGDCYADLRMLQAVDRRYLDEGQRLASMSTEAVNRLQLQLVGFLVRPENDPGGAELRSARPAP